MRRPDPEPTGVVGASHLAGRRVEEAREGPDLRLREWEDAGLACGITTAGAGDYGVSGNRVDGLLETYGGLARRVGFGIVAVPRQVHATEVREIAPPASVDPAPGGPLVVLAGRVDGLLTRSAGLLLAATAADCVPVYLHDPTAGVVGLAHAGWRGVAGGILARAVAAAVAAGARRDGLALHLGPAICGACYEVDAPVLRALGQDGERARVDLRGLLVAQAASEGIDAVTVSAHCTRCGSGALHSHRGSGGQAGRMAAFTGVMGTGR